jgi:hypothetical protein
LDSFTYMQSCCYGTYAAHQEVLVCPKIGGERAEGEEGGDAGGGAGEGTEGEEESIGYQDHGYTLEESGHIWQA